VSTVKVKCKVLPALHLKLQEKHNYKATPYYLSNRWRWEINITPWPL